MNSNAIIILAVVAFVAGVALYQNASPKVSSNREPVSDDQKAKVASVAKSSDPTPATQLPRMVDLGADRCKACKDLAPILEQLRKEYEGRVRVEFIDVWKNPQAGEPYKIRVIPTQIFFDAQGREVWRHEGFLPKAGFIAKFKELGVQS